MKKTLYKLSHSLLPCLLLTTSVGMIYAFSLFIPELTEHFGVSRNWIQFAFSLSIFWLGTGAATFGNLVEKNVKLSAGIATALFSVGLLLAHFSVATSSLWMLYAGIGVCCGLAEGIAYLCPVKNMVMWFSKSRFKGLVMAVSIVSFGLGASLCTLFYQLLYPRFGLDGTFAALAGLYLLMMSVGTALLRKPKYAKRVATAKPVKIRYFKLLGDPYFLKHWLFMFMNISMGLILIGNRKNILIEAGVSDAAILTVFAICGFANAFGRLLFPFIGDLFKNKLWIVPCILVFELCFMSPAVFAYSVIPVSLILVECGYGGMFATAPQILLSQYGRPPLSVVHGLLLTSWGLASLFAFACVLVVSYFVSSFYALTIILSSVYLLMTLYSLTFKCSGREITA